jgi:hypothetical protein
MLGEGPLKTQLENSFATVNENSTLAEAKAAMDALNFCQDVFVTKAGTKNEPVIGWTINSTIEDNARV